MKKIHRTRAELLRELNYTAKCRRNSYSASFSGLSVYLTHILVFQEKWRPGQIQKLYQAITDGLADESFDIDTANARLKEKTGVAFEVVRHEDSDIHISKKKKYRYMIVQKLNEAEDEICTYCMRWCLIAYSYLMDNGFGKKRITRINDALKDCLEKSESGVVDAKVAVMRQELIDAGYIIEMPKEWILLRSRT
ncbi:hypothetical protein [Hominiventricola filiformis]|uniref:Uncharacterized protein n=1 Tax=Hominiventricola filiformis TaxID=2885352 RepID=A0AAE3DB80_9FIRM|nr:hypothetical protein [Hominiventricola filiformis]MCC2125286.1 hypothetical protein [Hominiventricola filiformis]